MLRGTAAGKNRVVPIRPGIQHLVKWYYHPNSQLFLSNPNNRKIFTKTAYYRLFNAALSKALPSGFSAVA